MQLVLLCWQLLLCWHLLLFWASAAMLPFATMLAFAAMLASGAILAFTAILAPAALLAFVAMLASAASPQKQPHLPYCVSRPQAGPKQRRQQTILCVQSSVQDSDHLCNLLCSDYSQNHCDTSKADFVFVQPTANTAVMSIAVSLRVVHACSRSLGLCHLQLQISLISEPSSG